MSPAALVGIDIGTTSAKGIAIDPESGDVLATAESGYPVSSPHAGWMEQPPEAWVTAAQEVLAGLRTGAPEILGIGFSGQMHGLVCLDAVGTVIRPAILWNDQRSAPQCAALEAGTGRDRLLRLTGNRALPGFTAPKLLWMRENEPVFRDRNGLAAAATYQAVIEAERQPDHEIGADVADDVLRDRLRAGKYLRH